MAKHYKVVNLKKPQWLRAENVVSGIDKITSISDAEPWITDRGSSLGGYELFVNFREVKKFNSFYQTILDCTHSTQGMKSDGFTGGDKELGLNYMRAAHIFGYTGIFAETFPEPHKSVSDKDCVIPTHELLDVLENEILKDYEKVELCKN
jgi:3-deoxy-D-manno-octulosonic acid (KDO) 8-phosphate synthase